MQWKLKNKKYHKSHHHININGNKKYHEFKKIFCYVF